MSSKVVFLRTPRRPEEIWGLPHGVSERRARRGWGRQPGNPSTALGCRWLSFAQPADLGDRKRTWVDLYGRPQTVLKTAGLRSTDVRQRPQQFSRMRRQSMNVRIHPPLSAALAVFLAVSDPS